MRKPKDTDFTVALPDVGEFRFGRRTFGDRIAIRREYTRLAGEQTSDTSLAWLSSVTASYIVLCVACPEGWENVENVDLIKFEKFEEKLFELHDLMGDKEDSFRKSPNKNGHGDGAGSVPDNAFLVPAEVSTSTD